MTNLLVGGALQAERKLGTNDRDTLYQNKVNPIATIPGAGLGLGALSGTGAMGSFLRAGLAKGLTDDEADLKDVLRTGAIAAAPQMIDAGLGKLDTGKGLGKFLNQPGKDGAPSFLSKAALCLYTDTKSLGCCIISV